MADLVCLLLNAYLIVLFAGALLSWFPSQPGGGLHQARLLIARVTDPVMLPVRRAIGASSNTDSRVASTTIPWPFTVGPRRPTNSATGAQSRSVAGAWRRRWTLIGSSQRASRS